MRADNSRGHGDLLLKGLLAWTAVFSVMVLTETALSWRTAHTHGFTDFDVLRAFARHASIYYAWLPVAFAALCCSRRWPLRRPAPWRNWAAHGMAATVLGLAHLAVTVALLGWHQPAWLASQGAGNTFVRLTLEWLHFEVLVYFLAVALWMRLGARAPEKPSAPAGSDTRLMLRSDDGARIVHARTVDWFEADNNAVRAHVAGEVMRLSSTMKALEARLAPEGFVRTHRRALANLARVTALDDQGLRFRSGGAAPLSRRQRAAVRERLRGEFGIDRSPA